MGKGANYMLNEIQRTILKAYGKAQMTLKSHAVIHYDFGNDDEGYLVKSCEELYTDHRCARTDHNLINWMHPHTHPDWDEFDITDEEYSRYMRKKFPLLFKNSN